MDDQGREFEARQAIIQAQQQVEQSRTAVLMAAQPDLWQQTTLPAGDWGVPQEWQLEQQQNAREAELAREHVREQERMALER